MTHPWVRWRDEFPILKSKTYLASHSLGAVPRQTANALQQYYDEWATMGIQAWEGPWWEAVLGFCAELEAILHAPAGSVAPMQNATRAMAAVASCFDYRGKRNRVVMTDLEFTTFYPFWQKQRSLGAEIVIVRSRDGLGASPGEIAEAVDASTLLVATCHAYFRSGAVQDLAAVAKAAHDEGAYVLGDGYQVVGSVPVDVSRLGVDFYVGGSHKWLCGGAGAGYLYVKPDLATELTPRMTGWFGLAEPFSYKPGTSGGDLHGGVFRFLDGTPNVPALYSAREGIRIIRKVGVEEIRKVSLDLTRRVMDWAAAEGMETKTPTSDSRRNGMVCIDFAGAREAMAALAAQGVIVDWRPDCGIRVSPHFYNNEADLERFFDGVAAVRRTTAGQAKTRAAR